MGLRQAGSAVRRGAGASLAALRRAAAQRRVIRLQVAWAAVMVASWVTTVSLSVVAFTEGGSAAVALTVLVRTVPGAIAGPLVGELVDRFTRQRCLVSAALSCGLVSAVAALSAGSLVTVTVLVTVVAVVTMLFRTAQSAIVPELVDDPAELTAANVLSSAVESVGVLVGPALAAGLLVLQGPELALGTSAALYAVAGLLVLRLSGRGGPAAAVDAEPACRTRDLLHLRTARLVLALLLAQTVLSGSLVVLSPAIAVELLDLQVGAVGVLTAGFGLGGVIGSLGLFALAGSRRLGVWSGAALGLWSAPLLLLPLEPSLAIVLALLAVAGAGNVLFDVTSVTLLQRGVPSRLLGRAFGAVETVVVVGLGAGAALAPVLDAVIGPAAALALLAAGLMTVALLSSGALRRLDRELGAPAPQVALLRAVPVFALLPPPLLERLALRLVRVELAAGQAAAVQGEPGTTWFLVQAGRLRVEVDGREVRELGVGDGFGEIALLREGFRTATVVALQPSVLWSLDGAVFLAALRADEGRALAAMDAVAERNLARAAPRAAHDRGGAPQA